MKNFDSLGGKHQNKKLQEVDESRQAQEKKLKSGRRWRNLSLILRNRWTLCQYPHSDCEKPSESVHHIRSAYHYPELFYRVKNCIPMCNAHHKECDHQTKILDDFLQAYWNIQVENYRKNKRL